MNLLPHAFGLQCARPERLNAGHAPGGTRPARPGAAVASLAHHTFLEAVRDKVLYLLLFFGIFVFGASRLLAPLALGEGRRLTIDLGFTAISAFGCLMTIFVGHQLIFREIERKTMYFLLSRPLRRWEFVAGKYLGLASVLGLSVMVMGALLGLLLGIVPGGAESLAFASFAGAVGLAVLEMTILAALAVLLAAVCSPYVAGLLTLGVWLIGHGSGDLKTWLQHESSPAISALAAAAAWVVPRLDLYGDVAPVLHGVAYPPAQLGWAACYAVLYATTALLAAALVLVRREFTL